MVNIPASVTNWLAENYPKPHVDPEWLEACYEWLITDQDHSPTRDLRALLHELEVQLLKSNLQDSMIHDTGIPATFTSDAHIGVYTGPPILLEVVAISEVGNSAFQLDQIRQVREERLASGAYEDEEDRGEGQEGDVDVLGEGPVPKYPRSMLSFELSDGFRVVKAMEYQPLTEFTLGKTKLGFKLQLKNARFHRGTVFLEPACVTLKGYETADREVNQKADFARSLRVRMGLPVDLPNGNNENSANNENPQPPQSPPPRPAPQPQPVTQQRAPLREISPPPSPPSFPLYNDDAELEPRRRKVPAPSTSSGITSRYWNTNNNNSISTAGPPPGQRKIAGRVPSGAGGAAGTDLGLRLPPTVRGSTVVTQASEDFDMPFDEDFDFDLMDEIVAGVTHAPPTRPAPPPPAQPLPTTLSKKGKERVIELDSDDDMYTDRVEDVPDVEFLREIEKAEMEAFAHARARNSTLSASGSGSHPPSSGSLAGSGSKVSSNGSALKYGATTASRPPPMDVIELDSDGEVDDKENVPVPTRHVRRRVMGVGGSGDDPFGVGGLSTQSQRLSIGRGLSHDPDDVINISDSDSG